jgi:hypothetical protein
MKQIFKRKKVPAIILSRHRTRLKKNRKRKKQRKTDGKYLIFRGLFFLSLFLYGGFFLYVLFLSPFFQMNILYSLQAQSELESEVKLFVSQYAQEKVFFLFPRESFFLFDEKHLYEELQIHFPLLREITVEKNFSLRRVYISGKEREFHIVWCPYKQKTVQEGEDDLEENTKTIVRDTSLEDQNADEGDASQVFQDLQEVGKDLDSNFFFDEFESISTSLSQKEGCFSVDDSGQVHQQTDAFQEMRNNLSSIVLVGMNGYIPQENEEIFEEEIIAFFLELPLFMEENLYTPIVEVFRIPSPFADEVTVRTQEGWDLLLRTDISLEETASLLRTFFVRIADQDVRNRLRWVDIRIPGHIYYALDEIGGEEDENAQEQEQEQE